MFELSGDESLDVERPRAWQALSSPEFLSRCFPGVERVVQADERAATVIVRPGFSFVRGTLEVTFRFTELEEQASARILVNLRGIGSSAELEARFEMKAVDRGTTVAWFAKSREVGGLLKAVSQGLLKAAAQKVAAETWTTIRLRLTETPTQQ